MLRKINVILLFIMLGTSTITYSQIFFGGRVGMNMSMLSLQPELVKYNKVSDFTPKLNVNFAAFGYFEIGPYIAIQPEIVYSRKGLKSTIDTRLGAEQDTLLTGEWTYSLDYFEIPLMIKLSLNSEGFDPFIEFGGYYGYMVYANYKAEAYLNNEMILDDEFSYDLGGHENQSLQRNEYGFKLGIGGTLELSKGMAFFSIRYSQGLTDIIKYNVIPEGHQESYNRVFMLTLGYAFELRKNTTDKVYYY